MTLLLLWYIVGMSNEQEITIIDLEPHPEDAKTEHTTRRYSSNG